MRKKTVPTYEDLYYKFITLNKTIQQIATEYKVGYGLAFKWLKDYNIKKPKELIYKNNPICQYRYKKGHQSWNKGIHKATSEKCATTYFTRERIMQKTK